MSLDALFDPVSIEDRKLSHRIITTSAFAPEVNKERLMRLLKKRKIDSFFDTVLGADLLATMDKIHGGSSVYFHEQIIDFIVTHFVASDDLIDHKYTYPDHNLLNMGRAIVRQAEALG